MMEIRSSGRNGVKLKSSGSREIVKGKWPWPVEKPQRHNIPSWAQLEPGT